MGGELPYNFAWTLTLNLLTTTIVAPPSNASKWQMGFNSVFKGLKAFYIGIFLDTEASEARSSYTAVNTAHHSQFLPF